MQIIAKKTVLQKESPTPCPKCGSVRMSVYRIPGKVPLSKMEKKFFYSHIIKCTNRKCNAVWNDKKSIIEPENYENWLKSPTKSLFEI
jgi:hypothetical protein